jgi:hypothetical protein
MSTTAANAMQNAPEERSVQAALVHVLLDTPNVAESVSIPKAISNTAAVATIDAPLVNYAPAEFVSSIVQLDKRPVLARVSILKAIAIIAAVAIQNA